jgi:hypothetical protein
MEEVEITLEEQRRLLTEGYTLAVCSQCGRKTYRSLRAQLFGDLEHLNEFLGKMSWSDIEQVTPVNTDIIRYDIPTSSFLIKDRTLAEYLVIYQGEVHLREPSNKIEEPTNEQNVS